MPADQGAAADLVSRVLVLVLARVEGDADALCNALSGAGFDALACSDMPELASRIMQGAGAVVLTQEVFAGDDREEAQLLIRALAAQPEWSDLPIILLAGTGAGEERAWGIARRLAPVGNISILERPVRRTTLLNAMAVALRARARQYQLRGVLLELAGHRERLEDLVKQRTAELAASLVDLHTAERLAALGTLAAGLGHDIANLTLPIRAHLESIASSMGEGAAREDVAAISEVLSHLTSLSAGMRLMALEPSRAGASPPATDLAAWGIQSASVLRAGLPRQVRLELDLPPTLGVAVPSHQLTQVVFNLVQNAGEAMAGQARGLVRVTAEAGVATGLGQLVSIRVIDDGPGMSPEVRARCFEPYFSTKGRAISTGMGLSMVRGIIQSAGGTVTVESIQGQGSTFTLTMPAAGSQVATTVDGSASTAANTVNTDHAARAPVSLAGT